MSIRPDAVLVHEDVQSIYDSWEELAARHRQPAQALWRSLQAALDRLRSDAQWGEVVRQASIPPLLSGEVRGVQPVLPGPGSVPPVLLHDREPVRSPARHSGPSDLRQVVSGPSAALIDSGSLSSATSVRVKLAGRRPREKVQDGQDSVRGRFRCGER